MTRSEFRARVYEYLKTEAQPFVDFSTNNVAANTFLNNMLREWSFLTLSNFKPGVTLNTTAGSTNWDMYNLTVFSDRIVFPLNVRVSNDGATYTPLRDVYDTLGPISYDQYRALPAVAAGQPTRWTVMPQADGNPTLVLYTNPGGAWARANGASIDAYVTTPDIDTGAGGEGTTISIPVDDEDIAASFVAARALRARAAGSSLSKMNRLLSESGDRMKDRMLRWNMLMKHSPIAVGVISAANLQKEAGVDA